MRSVGMAVIRAGLALLVQGAPHRVFKSQNIPEDNSPSDISCCPFTGTIVIFVPLFHVILTHIDFAQEKFEFLDFSKYRDIQKLQLINRSKQLLLYTDKTVVLYDMMTYETIRVYIPLPQEHYNYGTLWLHGKLIDYHNQVDFDVNCKNYRKPIRIGNPYDYRRYMGYANEKDEFVVMDVHTGIPTELFKLRDDTKGFFILDSIGYVVHCGKNFEIYSLETYDKVFEYSDNDIHKHIKFLSQDLVDYLNNKRFLTYNNVKNIWVWANKKEKNSEETDYPLIKHFFKPFPLMRLYDYGDEVVYLLNLYDTKVLKPFRIQPEPDDPYVKGFRSLEVFIGICMMVDVNDLENVEPEEPVESKAKKLFLARVQWLEDSHFSRQREGRRPYWAIRHRTPPLPNPEPPPPPPPPQDQERRIPFRELKGPLHR
ncbi:unnamed protein product [Bursaphelenchus okinawaensis]|uniref:Uncharacterized protein n=1 Tax=Bursaphelenchus okinawaensis TaxID=465554 RepID=A0A811JW25_9BILA|nr:unnamed protein product [Bursaphelenchus okinawaensis]CAG9085723.1 unnamed protein product [Bursaphelenchus okinawaensis]